MSTQEQVTRKARKGVVQASAATEVTPVSGQAVDDAVDQIKRALGQVHVVYGDQHGSFDVAGETVAQVRTALTEAFGIEQDAKAFLNGDPVEDGTILEQYSELEFIKKTGKKG